jgi:hypothetical protein
MRRKMEWVLAGAAAAFGMVSVLGLFGLSWR